MIRIIARPEGTVGTSARRVLRLEQGRFRDDRVRRDAVRQRVPDRDHRVREGRQGLAGSLRRRDPRHRGRAPRARPFRPGEAAQQRRLRALRNPHDRPDRRRAREGGRGLRQEGQGPGRVLRVHGAAAERAGADREQPPGLTLGLGLAGARHPWGRSARRPCPAVRGPCQDGERGPTDAERSEALKPLTSRGPG